MTDDAIFLKESVKDGSPIEKPMEPKHLDLPDIGHSLEETASEIGLVKRKKMEIKGSDKDYQPFTKPSKKLGVIIAKLKRRAEERSVKKKKKMKLQELENDCNGNTSRRSLSELDTSKEEHENRGNRTPNDSTATGSQFSTGKNASFPQCSICNNIKVKFQSMPAKGSE